MLAVGAVIAVIGIRLVLYAANCLAAQHLVGSRKLSVGYIAAANGGIVMVLWGTYLMQTLG